MITRRVRVGDDLKGENMRRYMLRPSQGAIANETSKTYISVCTATCTATPMQRWRGGESERKDERSNKERVLCNRHQQKPAERCLTQRCTAEYHAISFVIATIRAALDSG
jgi:hypothetical protein